MTHSALCKLEIDKLFHSLTCLDGVIFSDSGAHFLNYMVLLDSGGILQTVDVCLTTVGPSVVPIPYPNVATSSDAENTASSVLINGNPACNLKSNFSQSTGDEAGDKKGIASGTTQGKAEFLAGSFNVLIEGSPAVRQNDLMVSNNKNTPPAPLNQAGAPTPPHLSVDQREPVLTNDNDEAQAVYQLDTEKDNKLLGQGTFQIAQGGFKRTIVTGDGQ